MSSTAICLDPPNAREHARAICDELWGATGLAAHLQHFDRVHVELFVEDMLDDFSGEIITDAEEKSEEHASKLADEYEAEADDAEVSELADIRAQAVAADILAELLPRIPKRSQATKLLCEAIADLRDREKRETEEREAREEDHSATG